MDAWRSQSSSDTSAPTTVQLPPPHPVIVPATDLGGVGVLKHGNLFLLSDPFGDIHPDSRGLGLYDLDTRVLSCAVLRINGVRPTLLRTQAAANHISTIQLTNPEYRRDPATKQGATEALAMRAISVTRRRWIAGGLAEHVEVTNYSATAQHIELELDLDADAADIFEVRGRVREQRGRYRSIESTPESLVFGYEGLDGLLRRTLLTFTPGEVSGVDRDASGGSEGSARIAWTLDVEPGDRASIRWEVSTDLTSLPGRAEPAEATPTRLARSVAGGGIQQRTEGATAAGASGPGGGGIVAEPTVAEEEYGQLDGALRAHPLRWRAARPRDPAEHRRPAPASERRPDARRALRGGRDPVVHDPLRAGQHHHGAPGAAVHAGRRARDAADPRGLAGDRGRPRPGHGAGQDPP